jgi:hypothetical protein
MSGSVISESDRQSTSSFYQKKGGSLENNLKQRNIGMIEINLATSSSHSVDSEDEGIKAIPMYIRNIKKKFDVNVDDIMNEVSELKEESNSLETSKSFESSD